MEKGDNTKRRRISTLGSKEMKDKGAKGKNYSFEVTQVKSSAELLKLYNIKVEKTNAESNKKASLQAQGPKGPTGNQPITIEEEEVFDGQVRLPKKIKKTHHENQKNAEIGKKQSNIGNERTAEAQMNPHIHHQRNAEAEKNSQIMNKGNVQTQKDVQERDQRTTKARNNSLLRNERTAEAANDSLLGNERASQCGKNHRTVEDDTSEQDDNSSEDEEDEASDIMDPDKKGMSLDMYFKVHGINLDEEDEEEGEEEEEEEDENEGKEKKRTRGKTNCKKMHSADFKDFEDVVFYDGQPGDVKQNHFMKYKTRKRMLKNRPDDIPEVQFRKLIRYWSLPEIRAMSEKNIENRSKQTCPHRTGSTGFGIVRKRLRESKENNEEPSRPEIFTVTRTSRKGKEIDPKSQSTIDELKSRIDAGQNSEEAFVQVLGKDQPGRLRCYGASVTKSSIKRHDEIRQVRGEYDARSRH
ncbi:hypothetical protein PIB30_014259 [Stylosanthes scabra]|uniref:Uncharacterized protein n=1 Tax=Stylosanthes scabra TaxID=79078 RepID=A0ABU6Y5I7_9FABA|nr:hypothetical protein [Stylosanthes scabra]